MIEKTEEQIAREKASVDAMKNAKSNMDAAISRISTLESALSQSRQRIEAFKKFVPVGAYGYRSETSLHDQMNEAMAAITKSLG